MALEWEQLVVDARNPRVLGHWWAEALGWVVVMDEPDEVEIRSSRERLPGILFGVDHEAKIVKNRLHPDFRPEDQEAEVARLLDLGATRVDVGQSGGEPWVVLADPEGNEFCILSSLRSD